MNQEAAATAATPGYNQNYNPNYGNANYSNPAYSNQNYPNNNSNYNNQNYGNQNSGAGNFQKPNYAGQNNPQGATQGGGQPYRPTVNKEVQINIPDFLRNKR